MFPIVVVDGGDEENDEEVMKANYYFGARLQRFFRSPMRYPLGHRVYAKIFWETRDNDMLIILE